MELERLILANLAMNEEYSRKVLPFIKEEYFKDSTDRVIYGLVTSYINQYNRLPTKEALAIELNHIELGQELFKGAAEGIAALTPATTEDPKWLLDKTEQWCQDRAIYNAIMSSVHIMDGTDNKMSKDAIPGLLTDALGVGFDSNIGHDYIDDYASRYEFYHKKEERIPFDLNYMNAITKGGLPRKTLSIFMAGTGVGKTLAMTHAAAYNLLAGKNVLYITLEMAQERIAERIDANLLDVELDSLLSLSKEAYEKKIARVRAKTTGKLVIKEFPTASAHAGHFRHLINELRLKKNFVPDIIYIDYLNICTSSRFKAQSAGVNSYTYIKAVAEELRGLGVEFNVPVVSATQLNRTGYQNSDAGLEDTSESFGLPMTADFMIVLITSEELEKLGQIMVKQLKNRWGDLAINRKFVLGIDKSKMRLYNVEASAQQRISQEDDAPTPAISAAQLAKKFPLDTSRIDFG